MQEYEKEELKRKLPEYVRRITEPDKRIHGMWKCPLCGSGSGSGRSHDGAFSIKDGILWKCFACGESGDIFKLIEKYEGVTDFKEQMQRAAEVTGVNIDYVSKTTEPRKGAEKVEAKKPTPGQFKSYIEKCQAAAGKTDYFFKRGFDPEDVKRFGLGYDESHKAIVIPYDQCGSYYISRSVIDKKFYKPNSEEAGAEPIYNARALYFDNMPCFVAESQLDAISIMIAAEGQCNAVAVGGTGYNKLIEQLKQKPAKSTLIINLDNDDKGKETTRKLSEALDEIKAKYIIADYTLTEYPEEKRKDANDYLCGNPEQFKIDVMNNINLAINLADAEKAAEREQYKANSAAEMLKDFIDGINKSVDTEPISTGFTNLDSALNGEPGEIGGGLYPGLYIIGAISSLGKTTLMLQIADQIASAGYDVLYFSLEMSAAELISKSLSRLTYLNCNGNTRNAKTARGITTASRYPKYSQEEKELIKKAMTQYRGYAENLYIYEGVGDIGAQGIRQRVDDHKRITGKTPIVFIDYLQILAPYDKRSSDKQNTDKAVLELKRLSRDYKTPVIAISSFNRDSYTNEVDMSAFKESGAIEYGSDVLMALQPLGMKSGNGATEENKKLVKDCKSNLTREVEAVILKNRNGRTGAKVGFKYYSLFNYFEPKEIERGKIEAIIKKNLPFS